MKLQFKTIRLQFCLIVCFVGTDFQNYCGKVKLQIAVNCRVNETVLNKTNLIIRKECFLSFLFLGQLLWKKNCLKKAFVKKKIPFIS